MDAEITAEEFMSFLSNKGFRGCPICGSDHGFSWGHSTSVPNYEDAKMEAYWPGSTTIPWEPGKRTTFTTPVVLIICDNCSYLMPFSKTHYTIYHKKIEGPDANG